MSGSTEVYCYELACRLFAKLPLYAPVTFMPSAGFVEALKP